MNTEIFDQARHLKDLRDEKKELENSVKALNADIDNAEYQLSQLMAMSETQNFTHAGMTYYLHTTTRASAAAEHREELFENLREHGFGDLIQETINASSLSAFVKEQTAENEDNLPTWLDGLVNVFAKTGVGMRKARG